MTDKLLGTFKRKKSTDDNQKKAVLFYKAYTSFFVDMMHELRCNIVGKTDIDPAFLSKVGSCVDGNGSLTLDPPGLAGAFLLTVLTTPGLEDAEVVKRIKRLGSLVRLPLKDVDALAYEASLVLVTRYGVQISLLEDDSIPAFAQVCVLRAVEYLAAPARPWEQPTVDDLADGARLGPSRDWARQRTKTKVQSVSGSTWIAEEVLGRCSIVHGGELLNDTGEEASVDHYGPMHLEDSKDPALFFTEPPDAAFLGEEWAMRMLKVAGMPQALPTAPTPSRKKRANDDDAPENVDQRIFAMTKIVDAELLPRFTGDVKKRVRESTSQLRQDQSRLSVDVRRMVRSVFVADKENHNLPPINAHFQDRPACLADIRNTLDRTGRVVITGPSGVGKSQAAFHFAHTALSTRKYQLVYRIECQTVTQVELSYRALAEFFAMDITSLSLAQIIHKTHLRMSNDPALQDFLLIFDDVPSEAHLIDFIPGGFPDRKSKFATHVIITSVSTQWARSTPIKLGPFAEAESSVLAFRQLPNTDKPSREELTATLKHHPLALGQAMGYIKHTGNTIASFLQIFNAVLAQQADKDPLVAVARAVTKVVCNELEQHGAVASAIADHVAFLSPAPVKEEIIVAVLRSKGADAMLGPGVLLCETMAILNRVGSSGTPAFQMHEAVRETRALTLPKTDAQAIVSTWISVMLVVYDRGQPQTKDLLKQQELLLPHAEVVMQQWQTLYPPPSKTLTEQLRDEWLQFATLMLNVARMCETLNIFDQALLFCERAQLIRQELSGAKHESLAEILTCQAGIHRVLRAYSKAAALYEVAYAIFDASGTDEPGLAAAVQGLSDVYFLQGELKKAQSGYEVALKLRQKAFGQRHELVAETMAGMARVLQAQRTAGGKAQAMMEDVLGIRKAVLQGDDALVADTLATLAAMSEDAGDIDLALERYNQAMKIYEACYAKDHPKIFAASLAIAGIYQQTDQDRALRYLQALLKLRKTVYGLAHADVAVVLTRIAEVYEQLGDSTLALDSYDEALESYAAQRVKANTGIANCLSCAGNLRRARGDFKGALEMLKEALDMRKKLLGDSHPEIALTYNNIAVVYDSLGDYDKALALYEDALRIQRTLLPKNHPDIGTTVHNMASLYDAKGDVKTAVKMYDEALRIRRESLGKDHPDVAATLNNMAGLYEAQKKYSDALKLYDEALKIRRRALGNEHVDVASTLNNIGGVYAAQKKTSNAIKHYEESLAIRRQCTGDGTPEVATTLCNLGLAYDTKGDVTTAHAMYEEALGIFTRTLGKDHHSTQQCQKLILGVQADL